MTGGRGGGGRGGTGKHHTAISSHRPVRRPVAPRCHCVSSRRREERRGLPFARHDVRFGKCSLPGALGPDSLAGSDIHTENICCTLGHGFVRRDGLHALKQYTVLVRRDGLHALKQYTVLVRRDGLHALKQYTVLVRRDGLHALKQYTVLVRRDGLHASSPLSNTQC